MVICGKDIIAPGTHDLRADQIDKTGKVIARIELPFLRENAEAVAALNTPAVAQYPNKPITVIVPFAAGGPTDVVSRLVCEHMSRKLGQPIIVENVGGAGGTLGMTRAAQAQPNGYTIAVGNMGTQSAAAALSPNLKYDPELPRSMLK